jgi:hypothetical protein
LTSTNFLIWYVEKKGDNKIKKMARAQPKSNRYFKRCVKLRFKDLVKKHVAKAAEDGLIVLLANSI